MNSDDLTADLLNELDELDERAAAEEQWAEAEAEDRADWYDTMHPENRCPVRE